MHKIKSILVVLLILLFSIGAVPEEKKLSEGADNYLTLRELYLQWSNALFGSKNSCRRDIYMFCLNMIDQEIETEPEFILISPIKYELQNVECVLRTPNSSWLYIHGPVTADTTLLKDSPPAGSWKQSLGFVRIKGVVRKFRLGKDHLGDTVDLWLTKVVLY